MMRRIIRYPELYNQRGSHIKPGDGVVVGNSLARLKM
jgi:ribosomal protein L27